MGDQDVMAALRERPRSSAKDVAVTLGIPVSRKTVGDLRARLERLEGNGVRRVGRGPGGPWLWELAA